MVNTIGESLPVTKRVNDQVVGSTINTNGTLLIRADKVGNETMLAQIIKMVETAQTTKAPIQVIANHPQKFGTSSDLLLTTFSSAFCR
jgi:Cu+-exporting ATPase